MSTLFAPGYPRISHFPKDCRTALHHATESDNLQMVQLLLRPIHTLIHTIHTLVHTLFSRALAEHMLSTIWQEQGLRGPRGDGRRARMRCGAMHPYTQPARS